MKIADDIKKFLDGRLQTIARSEYPYSLDGLRCWLTKELEEKRGFSFNAAYKTAETYLRNIILTEAAACYVRSIP